MTESSNQLNLTIVALVALVAIVGLVALVMNAATVVKVPTGSRLAAAEEQNAVGDLKAKRVIDNTAGKAVMYKDLYGASSSGGRKCRNGDLCSDHKCADPTLPYCKISFFSSTGTCSCK